MMTSRCLISLGGNLNVTPELFSAALSRLDDAGIHLHTLSSPLRTRPVGALAGTEFLNAAAVIHTSLSAEAVLQALHRVEAEFGRVRTVHWGPRTLDLDLLLYDSSVIQTTALVVPHPALWYRRFVLDPAIEIAASWKHPLLHLTLLELQRRLLCRPLMLEVALSATPSADGEIALSNLQLVVEIVCRRLQQQGITTISSDVDQGAPLPAATSATETNLPQVEFRLVSDWAPRHPSAVARLVLRPSQPEISQQIAEESRLMISTTEAEAPTAARRQPIHGQPFEIEIGLAQCGDAEDQSAETIEHLVLAMLG